MKSLKSIIILTVLVWSCLSGIAQDTTMTSIIPKAQAITDKLKEKLTGITPEQASKILPVEVEYVKEQEKAKISSKGDKDIQECKMRPLPIKRDMKIKTILTDAQYKQYTKLVKTDYKFKTECDGYK